ncbi:MAG: hypothetical protein BA863_04755 [Desulfovibrio sp. S3730MH75]|nr:MAG: hypothetical protein BA863_04755 [Desulfovibrio sp. S3730MH75]
MKYTKDGITYHGELAETIKNTPDSELYYYDIIEQLTDELYGLMEHKGMTKADLAKTLEKSRSAVSQALGGGTNFTIKTLANYLCALDGEIVFKIIPKHQKNIWTLNSFPLKKAVKKNSTPKMFAFSEEIPVHYQRINNCLSCDDLDFAKTG